MAPMFQMGEQRVDGEVTRAWFPNSVAEICNADSFREDVSHRTAGSVYSVLVLYVGYICRVSWHGLQKPEETGLTEASESADLGMLGPLMPTGSSLWLSPVPSRQSTASL